MARHEDADPERGTPPSGAARPSPERTQMVDEDTPLRIRPDEKTPAPGHEGAKRVPDELWEKNEQRKSTSQGLATGDELPE